MVDADRQLPDPRIERTEVERVGERDRFRPHRKDIPEDPPDPGGGSTVRLDRRRMVVRLDPQRVGEPVLERHDPGVARPEDPGSGGEAPEPLLQPSLRTLVATVFAPALGEARELHIGGVAVQGSVVRLDAPQFGRRQAETSISGELGEAARLQELDDLDLRAQAMDRVVEGPTMDQAVPGLTTTRWTTGFARSRSTARAARRSASAGSIPSNSSR